MNDRVEKLLASMDPAAAMESLRRWLDSDDAQPRTFVATGLVHLNCGHVRPMNVWLTAADELICLACNKPRAVLRTERIEPTEFPHPDALAEPASDDAGRRRRLIRHALRGRCREEHDWALGRLARWRLTAKAVVCILLDRDELSHLDDHVVVAYIDGGEYGGPDGTCWWWEALHVARRGWRYETWTDGS